MYQPGRSTDCSLIRSPSLSCPSRGCTRARASLPKSPSSTQAAPASIAAGAAPLLFAPASGGISAPALVAAPAAFSDDGADAGSGHAGPAPLSLPVGDAVALVATVGLALLAAEFGALLAAIFAALPAAVVAGAPLALGRSRTLARTFCTSARVSTRMRSASIWRLTRSGSRPESGIRPKAPYCQAKTARLAASSSRKTSFMPPQPHASAPPAAASAVARLRYARARPHRAGPDCFRAQSN